MLAACGCVMLLCLLFSFWGKGDILWAVAVKISHEQSRTENQTIPSFGIVWMWPSPSAVDGPIPPP